MVIKNRNTKYKLLRKTFFCLFPIIVLENSIESEQKRIKINEDNDKSDIKQIFENKSLMKLKQYKAEENKPKQIAVVIAQLEATNRPKMVKPKINDAVSKQIDNLLVMNQSYAIEIKE